MIDAKREYMYLNERQTRVMSSLLANLASDYDETEIRHKVGKDLLDLMGADHFASFIWNVDDRQFGNCVAIDISDEGMRAYEAHYQFIDPITHKLQAYYSPVLSVQVMPQEELVKTEFFNDFLAPEGMFTGLNFHVHDGTAELGDFRIWRTRRKGQFDKQHLDMLNLLKSALVAALRRAGSDSASKRLQPMSTTHAGMIELGSALSQRESDVAIMIARGCQDKEIARHLCIEVTTVRTHLKHLFQKLNVPNRARLAHLLTRHGQ